MKIFNWHFIACIAFLFLAPAQAAMVSTSEIAQSSEITQSINRDAVRLQVRDVLIENGVEPAIADQRVDAMSEQQLASLQEKISGLPVGAGVSTTDLLLVIIILVLLL